MTYDGKLEVRAEKVAYADSVDLLVLQRGVDGVTSVGAPLVMRPVQPDDFVGEPTLRLGIGAAQLLMDELWRCGLRPSEGTGSAGSLAATERHLKDMRDVALGLLRKTGVQV